CLRSVVDFFFQAEDGIRDLIVTGVQTCALPICSRGLVVRLANGIEYVAVFNADPQPLAGADFISELLDGSIRQTYLSVVNWPTRSEERRVGKEQRYQRWR